MEFIVKIKDKKVYASLLQFLKSIGISISTPFENKSAKSSRNKGFHALHLKTKGAAFNREEANAR